MFFFCSFTLSHNHLLRGQFVISLISPEKSRIGWSLKEKNDWKDCEQGATLFHPLLFLWGGNSISRSNPYTEQFLARFPPKKHSWCAAARSSLTPDRTNRELETIISKDGERTLFLCSIAVTLRLWLKSHIFIYIFIYFNLKKKKDKDKQSRLPQWSEVTLQSAPGPRLWWAWSLQQGPGSLQILWSLQILCSPLWAWLLFPGWALLL